MHSDITIPDVPEETRDKLVAIASGKGQSLNELLLNELERIASVTEQHGIERNREISKRMRKR